MSDLVVVHDFAERMAWSATLSDEGDWAAFYQRVWPDLLSCVRIDKDSKLQRDGVDRIVFLPHGRQFSIDEKKRSTTYDDFLLEEWSSARRQNGSWRGDKVGWTLDPSKRCDFIAYAIPRINKCYLLPFEILRLTCSKWLQHWKTMLQADRRPSYPKLGENEKYTTINCAVAWKELALRMWQEMKREFGSPVSLPSPKQDAFQQIVFSWFKDNDG